MNPVDVTKQSGSQEAYNDCLEQMRWPDGVERVQCGSKKVSKYVKQAGRKSSKPRFARF